MGNEFNFLLQIKLEFLRVNELDYTEMTATFGTESYNAFKGGSAALTEKLGFATI